MNHHDKCTDLLQLNNSSETSVVTSLLERFEAGQIYTWLGENVLISLNPNCELPDLYSTRKRQFIAEIHPSFLLHSTPHLYSLAEQCFRRMRNTDKNQSIIISGLSGSGKTEAAKHILHYLVYRNHERRCQEKFVDASKIEETLLKSNIILESFGNAQTVCNRNSSRFGKYMCLHFDQNQFLLGSSLQIYLLEKPRSLFDAASFTSSFHVFRLFLSSLKDSELIELGLDSLEQAYADNIRKLNMRSEDASTWNELLNSLYFLGFLDTDINQLRLLLAAIILLNAVRFLPASTPRAEVPTNYRVRLLSHSNSANKDGKKSTSVVDGTESPATIHSDDADKVIWAGRLLGLPAGEVAAEFARQLTTRHVQAGSSLRARRLTEYIVPCTVSQAREQRDCLVKALYHGLFEHLVESINNHLNPELTGIGRRELGILDLFGFEILNENGFEQFCINYANERLHQTFMRIAVRSIQDELISEGLTSEDSAISDRACDNNSLLTVMKGCAGLLDEVCLLNRVYEQGSASPEHLDPREVDWLRRMQIQFTDSGFVAIAFGHPSTPSSKTRRSISATKRGLNSPDRPRASPCNTRNVADCFTVQHFAGRVTYNVQGFVVKNLDRLPVHLINWLTDAGLYCPEQTSFSGDVQMGNRPPSGSHDSGLIRTILTRMANSAAPVQPMKSSPLVHRSPLQQRNTPARLVNTPDRSPENHCAQKLQLHRYSPKDGIHSPAAIASRRINTVFGSFRSSLKSLLERLETHQTSFVRCLRPLPSTASVAQKTIASDCISAARVDREHVKSQLVSGGLVEALSVLHAAFPSRYTYAEFIQKYRILWRLCSTPPSATLNDTHIAALTDWYSHLFDLPQTPSKRTPHSQRRDTGESETQQQQRIVLLLLILGLSLNPVEQDASGQSNANPPEWLILIRQFGRTRIHLTRIQMERLDALRDLLRNRAAKCIQQYFRRYLTYTRASRSIQRWWRDRHSRCPVRGSLRSDSTCTLDLPPNLATPTYVSDENLTFSPVKCHCDNTGQYATYQSHIVSCRSLFDQSSMKKHCSQRYWCSDRLNRLNCLIPFIHLPRAHNVTCTVRGLIDALS